jgi:lipoprotein-releasing system ATP-binding protein
MNKLHAKIPDSKLVLLCRHVRKTFNDAEHQVDVFTDINLEVKPGECIGIIGRSGAGKSTLLHLLGGLDQPTSGEIILSGHSYQKLDEKQKSSLRNKSLGFIYQFHHLLPEFSALENACMPLLIGDYSIIEAQAYAKELLTQVGLGERLHHKVAQLSGGERQRVAIVRALITKPLCVLADEPTGNLDSQTAEMVFEMMLDLNREMGTSLIIVTHDEDLAHRMDRVLMLEDGQLKAVETQ